MHTHPVNNSPPHSSQCPVLDRILDSSCTRGAVTAPDPLSQIPPLTGMLSTSGSDAAVVARVQRSVHGHTYSLMPPAYPASQHLPYMATPFQHSVSFLRTQFPPAAAVLTCYALANHPDLLRRISWPCLPARVVHSSLPQPSPQDSPFIIQATSTFQTHSRRTFSPIGNPSTTDMLMIA
ncbi:hypothetical protein QCA50_020148 [Cerrena zonata]|uniref:Uncharacterized protein n=1 Tax=Cerrena zonata TaxID=2478898 RepID=A0AAW0FCU3_9APHY